VFVLDSSASLGEKNWWKTKQFVIDVSKGLTIGPQASRVAVVIYSNGAYKMWDLTAFNNMDELEANIWSIEHVAGNTNTYEGMLFAQQILDDSGRKDFKHIVIVITDGKSNNKADLVAPQAEEMHEKGTEVFCVGVSDDVDKAEIETIASEPKAEHAQYVIDYDALIAITNVIISDTCEAANRVECEAWSVWSQCVMLDQTKSCGSGISSRARTCKFYTFPNDPNPEIRIHTEHRPCDNACDRCARCLLDVNGVGYIQHDNCHQFIQCEYVDGGYIEHEKSCGALFWRQELLTCDREHDADYTCTDGPVLKDEEVTTPAFVCDKDAHNTDVSKYVWHTNVGDVVMPCAPGTVFNSDSCQCVRGGGIIAACDSDALLEFPFNADFNDICNRASGYQIGNVTLEDGAAYFDGSSRVEIGYLKNWFANNPTTQFTVSAWFRYTGKDSNFHGIFTNGDCADEASVLIGLGNGVAQGQLIVENSQQQQLKAVFDDAVTTLDFTADAWALATMVYTGDGVHYYINGVKQASRWSINGPIQNTQCAANVGFTGKANTDEKYFFEGYIDDVRVYTKTLWDFDIQQLYNNGRQ